MLEEEHVFRQSFAATCCCPTTRECNTSG